jgi:sulfite exporter TauE/SafE
MPRYIGAGVTATMALIFIFMGLSVHSIADFDKFNLEFNEIQQFISNWNSNYRLKANEINILVGLPISEKTSTGSTVITLD